MSSNMLKELVEKNFFQSVKDRCTSKQLSQFGDVLTNAAMLPQNMVNNLLGSVNLPTSDKTDSKDRTGVFPVGSGLDISVQSIRYGDPGLFFVQAMSAVHAVVNQPYDMGKIACVILLNKLLSVGITQVENIVLYLNIPFEMSRDRKKMVSLITKGFRDTVHAENASITIGQVVITSCCTIGGVASTICSFPDLISSDAVVPGDMIVLTKPLGTQLAMQALRDLHTPNKTEKLQEYISKKKIIVAYDQAVNYMMFSNKIACELMHKYETHGATHVGSYGIIGHAQRLAAIQKNPVDFKIYSLPSISSTALFAALNSDLLGFKKGCAPEISGGLLICMPRQSAFNFCIEIQELGMMCRSWAIGVVSEGTRTADVTEKPVIIEVGADGKITFQSDYSNII